MSDALVSSLRELAAKATKAPWLSKEWNILADNEYCSLIAEVSPWNLGGGSFPEQAKANHALILTLRNSLDALLSRIDAADAMEEAVKKANDWIDIDHALAAYSAAKKGAADA